MKFAGVERKELFTWGANRETDLVKSMLRHDYAELKASDLLRDSEHYLGVLGGWERKWGAKDIILGEQSRPPGTQFNESFPGTSDTFGGDLSWTESTGAGTLDNVAGEGNFITADADSYGRADSDMGSSDHDVSCILAGVANTGSRAGPCVRWSSAASTFYFFWARNNASSTYRIGKVVAGSKTTLQTVSTTAAAVGSVLRLNITDDDLTGYDDEVSVITVANDPSITTGVRGGAFGLSSGGANRVQIDDWLADDGIGAGGRIMASLVASGGLAGLGGIVGKGGGLAG